MRLMPALVLAASALAPVGAAAQSGQRIVEVVVEEEARPVTDPAVLALVETAVGEPLNRSEVDETMRHLFSLGRYEDVQPIVEPAGDGIRLRYVLLPLHPVDRIELRGTPGIERDELRRIITDRFGTAPPARRSGEIESTLQTVFRERGYPQATVAARVEEAHNPDRATLAIEVNAGPRALVADVRLTQTDAGDALTPAEAPAVRANVPYDGAAIERELREWEQRMRGRGYYEARASHGPAFDPDGRSVYVTVNVRRGPRVVVEFTGDPIPGADRDRLVPIREEASADEDLLEDSARAIETYFRTRGYRDARAVYTPTETPAELRIVFDVTRGPRHLVREVRVTGAAAVPAAEINRLVAIRAGDPFVQSRLAAAEQAITQTYRNAGFIAVKVTPGVEVLPPAEPGGERDVDVVLGVAEGPRTEVRTVAFRGARAIGENELRAAVTLRAGGPYAAVELIDSRDRLELEYRNRGYETAVIGVETTFAENETRADVVFAITEGTQTLVDDIIIVGNERTSAETIRRELEFSSGQPLGFAAMINSRSRLVELGLFRRIEIEPLQQAGDPRRDVIIRVQELDPRTFGWGGGLEGGFVSRASESGPDEVFEMAPRGFVELGRRNLWGKNRSVNLFARVSLRHRDAVVAGEPVPTESGYGFNEYRIAGTFNEPRFLDTRAQFQILGIVEQAIRTSFSFRRRELRAELDRPLSPRYRLLGRYSFQRTELFDEKFRIGDEEAALIDRVFPQVRLSKFAGSLIRDTRDDQLDPEHGTLTILDVDVAARAIGSEVGFVKSLIQTSWFQRLPAERRMVVALNGRIGLARGFSREVTRIDEDGNVTVERIDGLPASERFFAGGATSVRGFALDRLANEETTGPTGFPTGGNGVAVLMSELRVNLFGNFDGIGIFDAGNVYRRASDLDLTWLRPAAGVGAMYRSDRFGMVRVDLGFNLDRRELVPGVLERGTVWHVSLSQSF
jgi:outer membrane protein insertion porin family